MENEQYHVSHTVLRDEANVRKQERQNEQNVMRRLRRAITGTYGLCLTITITIICIWNTCVGFFNVYFIVYSREELRLMSYFTITSICILHVCVFFKRIFDCLV